MIEPGESGTSTKTRSSALRRYSLNGGFLMVDDFWGTTSGTTSIAKSNGSFPIANRWKFRWSTRFFTAFTTSKRSPQIPSINSRNGAAAGRYLGAGRGHAQCHYKAIFDDNGRMMAFICHNTDLGDGWEREGENEWYFHEFSEKKAYPLGINIVIYAMTH